MSPAKLMLLLSLSVPATVMAQRPNPAALERRATQLKQGFLVGLDELAADYEAAGMLDKAKETLRQRLELAEDPDARETLETLEERDFDLNRRELKLEPAGGWFDTGCDVVEGEAVRIEASGRYRLILNREIGPDGLAGPRELGDVRIGSLAAIVYPPRTGRKVPEPGEPRTIDDREQFEPAKSGRLFLRVALPEGAKAVGTLDVVISGRFRPGRR